MFCHYLYNHPPTRPSFTGDNHTANNFPLRGAKYSNWEGGVRVNAFVAGGYLAKVAPRRVGSKLEGFVHICDYYTTFAAIAGIARPVDHRAALAGLPPIDGENLWPYLSGQTEASPRTEVWNDLGVIIMGRYKLYNASGPYGRLQPDGTSEEGHACFPGPVYPNGTSPPGGAGAAGEKPLNKAGFGQCQCAISTRCVSSSKPNRSGCAVGRFGVIILSLES